MPAAAPPTSARFAHAGVLVLTVLVFAVVVLAVALQLRAGLREQILQREAGMLAAVAALQLENRAAEYGDARLSEVPGALLVAVLRAAKFRDVVAVRVFDARGVLNSSDGIVGEMGPPSRADWLRVTQGAAFARLHRGPPRDDVFLLPPGMDGADYVEAWVPLRSGRQGTQLGAAQFWLEGVSARAEVRDHDRRLWFLAVAGWAAGSAVIVLALGWSFSRLEAVNRELRLRSEDLERANGELVLAAKTSALGTVTAHLMHELKNPLAGLELLVAGQAEAAAGNRGDAGAELAAASALARRLRTMVNDVVGVLRDEQTGAAFELSCADVLELVVAKVTKEASARGIALEADGAAGVSVAGRRANLAILILRNLVQNALEAMEAGGKVRISGGAGEGGESEFVVADTGPGLPESVRARLFQPCASTKSGGSGLGLALSQQLAQQAGGRLELVRSDGQGTSFRLVLGAEA